MFFFPEGYSETRISRTHRRECSLSNVFMPGKNIKPRATCMIFVTIVSLSLSCCLLELLTTTKFQSRFSLIVSNSTLMYKYLCSYCCKCSSSEIHPFWTFSSTILSNFIFQPTTRKMALPIDSFATNHVFIMA